MSKKVLIVGTRPPPVGGVSVHIERFIATLQNRRPLVEVNVLNYVQIAKKWKYLFGPALLLRCLFQSAKLYHLHKPDHLISVWWGFLVLAMLGKTIVVTLHNSMLADQLADDSMPFFKRLSLRIVFPRFSHIVCVNERTAAALLKEGVRSENISIIPAYIPSANVDSSLLPKEITDFVELHSPLLTGYSHRIYSHKGQDCYGGDMMLEAVDSLVCDHPNMGLVLVIPNASDPETADGIRKYEAFMERKGILNNILIVREAINLPSLFALSDIHVRPSNTDGDPVAVRESLQLGVPTIASDCTQKPEGTLLHKDRDCNDFIEQIRLVLEDVRAERERVRGIEQLDFSQDLIDIYDRFLGP